jgi:hypothetical protein
MFEHVAFRKMIILFLHVFSIISCILNYLSTNYDLKITGYLSNFKLFIITGFFTFSIVRYSRKQKTRRFGNWICFRPQMGGGRKTPIQLGHLERANIDHNRPVIEISSLKVSQQSMCLPPLTRGRKQIQFPKRHVFYFLEYRTTAEAHNPSNCVIHHRQKPLESAA